MYVCTTIVYIHGAGSQCSPRHKTSRPRLTHCAGEADLLTETCGVSGHVHDAVQSDGRTPALKHILLRLVYVSDGIHFCVCALFCCSVWCCVGVTVTSNSSLPLTAIDSLTVQTNVFSDCMSLRGPLRQTNVISFSDSVPISRGCSVDMRQAVAGGQHDSEFNARRSRFYAFLKSCLNPDWVVLMAKFRLCLRASVCVLRIFVSRRVAVIRDSLDLLLQWKSLKPSDSYRSPHNSQHPRPG